MGQAYNFHSISLWSGRTVVQGGQDKIDDLQPDARFPYDLQCLQDRFEPRFPFGNGLSYTTFEYTNLSLSEQVVSAEGTLRVGVDITNTGASAGEEVVQLYVSYEDSRVDRPVKALKGFAKIHVSPGQTRRDSV